jgi:outer membrane protein assembly factor BamB
MTVKGTGLGQRTGGLGGWALALLGALGVLSASGASQAEPRRQTNFRPEVPARESAFGYSVAVDGSRVVVGAPHLTVDKRIRAGGAFVFDAASGELLRSIPSPEPAENGGFGVDVALEGDVALIGAPGNTVDGHPRVGAAYAFDLSTGKLLGTLTASEPGQGRDFGFAVDFLDGKPVIGAYTTTPRGLTDAGAVFRFDGLDGKPSQTILAPRPGINRGFGLAFAILGRKLVVGAPHARVDAATLAGRVFVLDPTNEDTRLVLEAPRPRRSANFGLTLAAADDEVYVGAPGDHPPHIGSKGVVYVFSATSGEVQRELVEPEGTGQGRMFGSSIVVAGDRVWVGAAPVPGKRKLAEGRVYVFDRKTGELLDTLGDPAAEPLASFGYSLAARGSDVVIGVPRAVSPATKGAAYLYADAPAPPASP